MYVRKLIIKYISHLSWVIKQKSFCSIKVRFLMQYIFEILFYIKAARINIEAQHEILLFSVSLWFFIHQNVI